MPDPPLRLTAAMVLVMVFLMGVHVCNLGVSTTSMYIIRKIYANMIVTILITNHLDMCTYVYYLYTYLAILFFKDSHISRSFLSVSQLTSFGGERRIWNK